MAETTIDVFTEDELAEILEAIQYVMVGAVAAEPDGEIGIIKEFGAAAKAVVETSKSLQSPLIEVIADSTETPDDDAFQNFTAGNREDQMNKGINAAVAANAIMMAKATSEEAREYRELLFHTAEGAVSATKSGGHFGIGGTRVTENERGYLQRLTDALGS